MRKDSLRGSCLFTNFTKVTIGRLGILNFGDTKYFERKHFLKIGIV